MPGEAHNSWTKVIFIKFIFLYKIIYYLFYMLYLCDSNAHCFVLNGAVFIELWVIHCRIQKPWVVLGKGGFLDSLILKIVMGWQKMEMLLFKSGY